MNFESQVLEVPIAEIIPNRFQPRLTFDNQAMEELASSIKEHGVIQPLVLRRVDDKYEIVAGERRYKASTIAGLKTVPAIITTLDDNKSAEVAIIENIQRKNLTPIEEAKAYKTILDKGYLTQESLAQKLGLSQSGIANKLRLLNLSIEVQQALIDEKISERHARSLLQLHDQQKQKEMLNRIIDERLTVRQLDSEINNENNLGGGVTMDQTPLVDLGPTVEEIKSLATEINSVKPSLSVESMMKPENPPAELFIESNASQPSPAGKFFNFLEDEEANMDTSESDDFKSNVVPSILPEAEPEMKLNVGAMPTNDIFSSPGNDNITPLSTDQMSTPVLNPVSAAFEPLNDVAPVVESAVELPIEPLTDVPTSPVVPSSEPEILDILPVNMEENQTSPIPTPEVVPPVIVTGNTPIDPMSKVETLSPDYKEPEVVNPYDYGISNAVNEIRATLENIEGKGLIVDKDEIALDDMYQIVIKINK